MVDVTQYAPQERGYDDIIDVQQPVADDSGALAARGVADVLQAGAQVKSAFDRRQASEAASEQFALEQEYALELRTAAEALNQSGMSDAKKSKVRTRLNNKELELINRGLSGTKIGTMRKTYEGLGQGAVLGEKSDAQRARDTIFKKATEKLYITDKMNEAEVEAGLAKYVRDEQERQAEQIERDRISTELARGNLSKQQREELERRQDEQDLKTINAEALRKFTPLSNSVNAIVLDDSLTTSEKKSQLQALKRELTLEINTFGAGRNKEGIDRAASTLYAVIDDGIAFATQGAGLDATDLENRNRAYQAQAELNVRRADASVNYYTAAAKLSGYQNVEGILHINDVFGDFLTNQSNPDGNPSDMTGNTPEKKKQLDSYFKLIEMDFSNLEKTDLHGNPLVDRDNLKTNMDNVIKSIGLHLDPGAPLEDSAQAITFLAKKSTGDWLKNNPASADAIAQADKKLFQTYQDNVLPVARNVINDVLDIKEVVDTPTEVGQPRRSGRSTLKSEQPRTSSRPTSGQMARGVKPTMDEVVPIIRNGTLTFTTTNRSNRNKVTLLNNKVAAGYTTYANALANLSDGDVDAILEQMVNDLGWEVGGSQQESQSTSPSSDTNKAVVGTKVPDHIGDGVKRDRSTGVVYVVRDGVVVEVRDNGN